MIVTVPPYWPDITSCRRRGKRLAETLLNYLAKVRHETPAHPFLQLTFA